MYAVISLTEEEKGKKQNDGTSQSMKRQKEKELKTP